MKTKFGTCNFVSFDAALLYYISQEPLAGRGTKARMRMVVQQKIVEGAIVIGKPILKEGETLTTNREGRYLIES